jgi:metallo-beta-lactamase class B
MTRLLAAVILLCSLAPAAWAQRSAEWLERGRPVPPQRIAGNLYYVGTNDLAAFLFTSPRGHVLLDGGLPETAPLILDAIRRLGFRPEDVRVLINSHSHFDHAGGLAELKRRTGAKLAASERDAGQLERGGRGDFALGDSAGFPPVTVDRRLGDGDTVRVGEGMLIAHLTPGHTRGCTTWTTSIRERGRDYSVVFMCSLSVLSNYRLTGDESYPGILADYRRSIAALRAMHCEIMLASHASFIDGFHEKLAGIRETGSVRPLVNPSACRDYADRAEQRLEAHLARTP